MKMTSALRYFGLLMLIGMLITGFRVGWTPALVNFTGLLMHITGASLLIISIMSRPATYFRIAKGLSQIEYLKEYLQQVPPSGAR